MPQTLLRSIRSCSSDLCHRHSTQLDEVVVADLSCCHRQLSGVDLSVTISGSDWARAWRTWVLPLTCEYCENYKFVCIISFIHRENYCIKNWNSKQVLSISREFYEPTQKAVVLRGAQQPLHKSTSPDLQRSAALAKLLYFNFLIILDDTTNKT